MLEQYCLRLPVQHHIEIVGEKERKLFPFTVSGRYFVSEWSLWRWKEKRVMAWKRKPMLMLPTARTKVRFLRLLLHTRFFYSFTFISLLVKDIRSEILLHLVMESICEWVICLLAAVGNFVERMATS